LLGKGVASAGEIAEISRVPRSRTYDVLETLEKKGFTIVKIGKPVKYIGVKPQIILERLKNDVKRDAQERLDYLIKIRETDEFDNLEEIYKGGTNPVDRGDLSVALKGRTNISGYLKEIIKKAEKEIIICTDVEDVKSKIKMFQQMLSILSQSKIKLKIALSGDAESIKKVEKILETKIKKVDLSAKFFIIDRKEILFYLSQDSEGEDSAIWLNSEFFSQAFAALFEKAFEN
jgi:sugar-specific transcriptional regulator TrmB